MKIFCTALVLVSLLPLAHGQSGVLTEGERTFATNYLKSTYEILKKQVQEVPDEVWKMKTEGAWSPADCFEHILVAELGLFQKIKGSVLESEAAQEKYASTRTKDGLIITWATDRVKKVKTIEPLEPSNRWATKAEMLETLDRSRAELIAYIETTSDPLRIHFGPTPVGEADAYQMLLIVGAHGYRHTKQMEEAWVNAKL